MHQSCSSTDRTTASLSTPWSHTSLVPASPYCYEASADPSPDPLYRASYASTVLAVIVCLSVRLSVKNRSCTKVAKSSITLTTPYDTQGLKFTDAKNIGEIPTTPPPTGAPNRGGVHIGAFPPISRYISKTVQDTFYGRLIETHMRSIEWRYFQ